MKRGWLRFSSAAACLAVLLSFTPNQVLADGNAGVHLHKTVDPARLTITPNIGVSLSVDRASAIPGDTLTYTAVVTNPTATFGMGGSINAQAVASSDAIVAYYWDQLESCNQGCGNGAFDPHWTALAAFEAGQPGYQPVNPPDLHTGMVLTAQSVARSGVTYPASGDPILGTDIAPSATATWTYASSVVLTPTQVALLKDPSKVHAVRNVLHFEVTPRNSTAAQPYTDPESFANPFATANNPGGVSNVTVTYALPDGSTARVGPAQLPALALLGPGASVSTTAQFKVPAPAARGANEGESAYVTRLGKIDGSALTATATAAGTGFSGAVTATSSPVTTNEFVPIVTIGKGGPAQVDAGSSEINPLTLKNGGGATAASLFVVDSVPGGATGTVSGVPASLAPGATGSASATYAVPVSQAAGDLTDTAAVTWKDTNGNSYGPLSSSFTTQVRNILFGARLTLAPLTAGPNLPGTSQTLTATLVDRNGNPIAAQVVNFAVTGANPTTGSAPTDANGIATFSYKGQNQGSDVVQATVTAPGGISLASNTSTVTWLKILQPVSTTVVQGNFFRNDLNQNDPAACSFGVGPGSAPVFSQSFPNIMFNPDPSVFKYPAPFIPANNNYTRPFTDVTTDVNGNPNGQIVAQGKGVAAGLDMINFYAAFTGTFVVNAPGDLTFRILHDDGYILGVGGAATRVNGDRNNDPATTPFNNYPVMAAWNTGSTGSSSSGPATVHFPAAGIYPYELDYTECNAGPLFLDLLTEKFVPQTSPLSIYLGYADGLRPGGSTFPFPWDGSPNTTFEGCSQCTFDGGAIRIDNNGPTPLQVDSVTVDVPMAPGVNYCPSTTHFDIWPHNLTVPPGQTLILAPEASGATTCSPPQVFDTSDTSFYCGPDTGVIPLVNLTSGGVTTTFKDSTQVLNTGGRDAGVCTGNESTPWQRIGGGGTAINVPLPPAATLNLTPFNVPGAIQGQSITLTVAALDGAGNPAINLPVSLQVSGANTQLLNKSTDSAGLVTFTYAGNLAGTDSVEASAFVGGLRSISNVGSVVWIPPGGTNNPLGPSITSPTPADGAVITSPVPVDATIAPPSGHSITGWRVFYQAASGGLPVVIGSGSGAPPSPLGVTFDPTLLADGTYSLTVAATADNGAVQDVVSGLSVYGALKLGRYQTQFLDLAVPVSGYNMQVLRTYDSTDLTNGDFGVAWRVAVSSFRVSANHVLGAGGWTQYNKSCTLGLCFTGFRNAAPRFVTVVYPDGHGEIFDFVPAGGTNVFWSCTPAFKARASIGSTSSLVPLDDTGCSYTGDGNIYGSSGVYNPHRFQLTTHTGQVFVLDVKQGLISMTDRNGNSLSVDSAGVHSSGGPSITFTRDGSGRITTMTGPSGQALTYTYSPAGDLASSTDPNGNVDTYTYDSNHRLLQVNGPQGAIASQGYDPSGRLISITDANGHTTQIQNDVANQTITFTDALRTSVTVLAANDVGEVVRSAVTSGGVTQTTQFAYDSVGHPVQKTDAAGNTVKATYDSQGNLATFVDGLGNATKLTYDSFGDVTAVMAPDGSVVVSVGYDANGNPATIQESGGVNLHFTFDAAGHITGRTDSSGHATSYGYDASGRMTQLTDPAGKSIHLSYDSSNRLVSVTDALGNVTTQTYDADGNVVRIVDARGFAETRTYGPNGQVTSVTSPLGTAKATYDADSNLTNATDIAGNATTYTYDADGRTTRIGYSDGDFLAYTFDGFGRPVTVANTVSSIDNTFDGAGNLVSTTSHGATFGPVTLSFTYDAAGNRLSSTGPDGKVSYAYNSIGQVIQITDPSGGNFGLQYDSSSRLATLARPNGVTDSYTYDVNGKLVGIASSHSGTTIQSLTQAVDPNGLASSRTDGSGTATFTHDADGRLAAVSGPGSVSQAYTYDAAGNRTSDPQSSADVYGAADQLTSDSNFTYTYDANGRRVSKTARSSGATTHYVWNGRGQLTSVQFPDGTTTNYTYDPLGRRLTSTSGGATTAYVYDGLDVRLEYGGASIAASYVDSSLADHPLEMVRGGAAYYYMQDFQGSVTGLTDASGTLKSTYSYDAFGIPTGPGSSLTNPFTYTGREYDAKSGLYYNRARYYEPSTGGFLSQDPLGTAQPYGYGSGDPVDFTDQGGGQPVLNEGQEALQTADRASGQRTIGCTVSYFGSLVEIGFNLADHSPKTSDIIQMAIGLVTGCVLSALSAYAGDAAQVLLAPAFGAVIAGLTDLMVGWICTRSFDFNRAIAVGAAALSIGILAGMFGRTLGDVKTVGQLLAAILGGMGSGALAGGLDITANAGGSSC